MYHSSKVKLYVSELIIVMTFIVNTHTSDSQVKCDFSLSYQSKVWFIDMRDLLSPFSKKNFKLGLSSRLSLRIRMSVTVELCNIPTGSPFFPLVTRMVTTVFFRLIRNSVFYLIRIPSFSLTLLCSILPPYISFYVFYVMVHS